MQKLTEAQLAISKARDIVEELGETCPVYVSFEKQEYTLTCEQIKAIASALYLADCELHELLNK